MTGWTLWVGLIIFIPLILPLILGFYFAFRKYTISALLQFFIFTVMCAVLYFDLDFDYTSFTPIIALVFIFIILGFLLDKKKIIN